MNLEQICNQAKTVILEVGQFIEQEFGQVDDDSIENKALNDLVSYVDKTAEQRLVSGLAKILPSSSFLTEEKTIAQTEGKLRWIIDPLDGTTNFLHQIPPFAISVALQEKNETVLGIVYEVTRKECFYTWKGSPAFLDNKIIKVSNRSNLLDSIIATGFMPGKHDWMSDYLKTFAHFVNHARGLRRHGAAAVDLAYVACGRFDAFYEYALNPWDVAAGAFLVQQAGGKVSDFQGGGNYIFGKKITASNGLIHDKILEGVALSSL